ncbi:MAG: hypothetical protein IJC87_05010 [Clostridia bacterium]|nr:hypothetical protein [Clostridia bacterium]
MKKRIAFIIGLVCLTIFSVIACNKSKDEHVFVSHAEVVATCQTSGNKAYFTCLHCDKIFDLDKNEIDEIPTVDMLEHDFEIKLGEPSTCSTKGTIDRYECGACKKIFDLNKEEITSIEKDLDGYNHFGNATYSIAKKPAKLKYNVGDKFDSAGMVISSKCEKCNGVILDNQYITVEYPTENATAFNIGDNKVFLKYQGVVLTIEGITVIKPEVVLQGVKSTYTTTCNTPISLDGIISSVIGAEIKCEYIKGANQIVSPFELEKGEYKVRIYVEDAENYFGTETVATLIVNHEYKKRQDENVVGLVCACKDAVFTIENGKTVFVDKDNPLIDLGSLFYGDVDYAISSVKKIDANKLVDIEGTKQGNVYLYSKDLYGQTGLYLSVTYTVNGEDYTAKVISKFNKVESKLQIGNMQYLGIQNEYGDVYSVTQDNGLIESSDKRPLTAFFKSEMLNCMPDGYDYFEFWIYNPTDVDYSVHFAGDGENGWMNSSSADTFLAKKSWTKVTISKADVQNNAFGTWYLYIFGGNNDGAKQEGWQISTVYAVKAL